MFAIQSVMPAGGMSLDAYPNPDNPAQWVLKLTSLKSGKNVHTYADATKLASLLPPEGAKLRAVPIEGGQWTISLSSYDDTVLVQQEFPGSSNVITALVTVIRNPAATMIVGPVLLQLFQRLQTA